MVKSTPAHSDSHYGTTPTLRVNFEKYGRAGRVNLSGLSCPLWLSLPGQAWRSDRHGGLSLQAKAKTKTNFLDSGMHQNDE